MPSSPAVLRFILIFVCALSPVLAQQVCPPPAIHPPDPASILFTPQQEMVLGDAIAEQVQHNFLVIDDDTYTAYLQKIADRLIAQAPSSQLKVRIFLFDLPVANAWTLPGGRIYVSRKIIALTHNEDELASVLGHELGHALSGQLSVDMTRRFRQVLGVNQLGDKEDVILNYQKLTDLVATKKKVFQHNEGLEKQEQFEADRIGMQLVSNAGYSAQSFVDFFDRLAETKGKTGSWLSDFFGTTSVDSRRLREILRQSTALSANCSSSFVAAPPEQFRKYQASVVAYSGLGHKEDIHGILEKTLLNPPLRADIRQIHFSPDGKFLLAQDDATIYVLTRQPFAVKFKIDALGARPAAFSPDSRSILFHTPSLRVENWSLEEESRTSVSELVVPKGCQETELSPEGKWLSCWGEEGDLTVYNVESGEIAFQKKSFYRMETFEDFFFILFLKILNPDGISILNMRFSPDGHYLLARGMHGSSIALDLNSMQTVNMPSSIRNLLPGGFSFVGKDMLAGSDRENLKNSGVVRFPGGESVVRIPFAGQRMFAAANPHYVLVEKIQKDVPVAAVNIDTKKMLTTKMHAIDVFEDFYIRERLDGEIALMGVQDLKEYGQLKLPIGRLGNLKAHAISKDFQWLAISGQSRGGIWNLSHNWRVQNVRGFTNAFFAPDGGAYSDFPKKDEDDRALIRMELQQPLGSSKVTELGDDRITDCGPILIRIKHNGKEYSRSNNAIFEVLNAQDGTTLWSRNYPKELPEVLGDDGSRNLVFAWRANSDGAKLEIKSTPAFAQQWGKDAGSSEDYFVEIINPRTGVVASAVSVSTGKGSFRIHDAASAGDTLLLADNQNRILIYSISSGRQIGKIFGSNPQIAYSGSVFSAQNERGEISLYDPRTLARKDHFVFSSPISFADFDETGKRLFVLTANQYAYVVGLNEK